MKQKWADYATSILKSIHTGATSIREIAEDIGSPEAYTAKIIAELRSANIINKDYEFVKPLREVTVREVLEASKSPEPEGPVSSRINILTMSALEIPLTEVW